MPPILREWGTKYGELFRTRAGTTDFIWLNSKEAVKELFDRRSAIYSSRQPMPMAFDCATGGKRITFAPYGKTWRDSRAVFHKVLTQKMAQDYSVIQLFEAKQLGVDLLNNPQDFYMHNRRYAASVIMQVTYGWRIPKWDCPEIHRIFQVLGRFVQCRKPGQWLVDVFPTLAKSRLFNMFSSWKRIGNEFHAADNATWMGFWNEMKQKVADGTAPHCFGKILQRDYEKQGLTESRAAWICGGLIEAGSETTSATLNNCLYLILSSPDCVGRAHEELDRVVGPNRTPTFDDEPNLPYIRGMIKETLRMRPINKFGNNHFNIEDDWYSGYFIPKGSIVMANWWSIHYDEKYYPQPDKFLPERWLDYPHSASKAAALPDGTQRDHLTYGGGRRICAGIHLAEKSLFINVARILWGFDIGLARNEDGMPIALDFSTKSLQKGSSSVTRPFPCEIKARSQHHEKIMREEWTVAQKKGIDFSHIQWSV
ncbi:cytochrome P450 [Trematosphaeria pertusa]|uniref:Cytochrome P450 n=1 Tax=Trematosphaeria pertusa TaxID=390896 RepID=A0A6A6IC82_9PLEO|nr:cytochrome P450 [Trematosphaeria pertusa]KAF2248184.1 cytochrome P450 [Trematosphaeria pertusa]